MLDVWVLGSKHQKAGASIDWRGPFPNFSNADVLIVNLQSLGQDALSDETFRSSLYIEARKQIFDMLMTGEKSVIVVMSSKPTQFSWLPLYPIYRPTAPAKIGSAPESGAIKDYLRNVETCPYYFHSANVDFFGTMTDPKSPVAERYSFSPSAIYGHDVSWVLDDKIQNVAKQIVGGSFKAKISYGNAIRGRGEIFEGHYLSGPTLFLPSPTKCTAEAAIESLLDLMLGTEKEPVGPGWENTVDIPTLSERLTALRKMENDIHLMNQQADKLNDEIKRISKLRRLLWADGGPLESAVREAFVILGFSETRKTRAENLEDWVIDFNHAESHEHAVFEVKASEKRTSMADLTQCNKWVEDYLLEGKRVKGIFVSNQYRLNDAKKSIREREQFAPNELDYARTREICILPTTRIFEALVAKMKTGLEPNREAIERKISESNGLCYLL
jgi:hypothetical protein